MAILRYAFSRRNLSVKFMLIFTFMLGVVTLGFGITALNGYDSYNESTEPNYRGVVGGRFGSSYVIDGSPVVFEAVNFQPFVLENQGKTFSSTQELNSAYWPAGWKYSELHHLEFLA